MKTEYNMQWLLERFDREKNLKFIFFWGHARKADEQVGKFCFSQWDASPFTVDGTTYVTAEHWMMAQKALLFGDLDICKQIISVPKPAQAKELGRKVRGFDEQLWNTHKYDIVVQGSIHKFTQNAGYKDYLLQTGDRILVEASPVDAVWGTGMAADHDSINNPHTWRGQNLLGFALMQAREILRNV